MFDQLWPTALIVAIVYGLFFAFYAAVIVFAGLRALSWWGWILLIGAGLCWLIGSQYLALTALVGAALNATYRVGFALGAEAGESEALAKILRNKRITFGAGPIDST